MQDEMAELRRQLEDARREKEEAERRFQPSTLFYFLSTAATNLCRRRSESRVVWKPNWKSVTEVWRSSRGRVGSQELIFNAALNN